MECAWISSPAILKWESWCRRPPAVWPLWKGTSMNRREAFQRLMTFAAGSPLLARRAAAQGAGEDVNGPVNVHEFEQAARRKMNKLAYDFIAGGVEDELTLEANRAAYTRGYLVMELVEGPTLAERIASGAIPLEESLKIGRQIADALEAAHEKAGCPPATAGHPPRPARYPQGERKPPAFSRSR